MHNNLLPDFKFSPLGQKYSPRGSNCTPGTLVSLIPLEPSLSTVKDAIELQSSKLVVSAKAGDIAGISHWSIGSS